MTAQGIPKILTREFVLCFFAQFTFTCVFHTLLPTLPIYLSRLGSTEVEIGLLVGVFGVSSLVLRPVVGRDLVRIPERNFMLGGALLLVLSATSYLVAVPFWPVFIVRVFQGFAMACFYTAALTLIANISPQTHRGRSMGYYFLAFNIALALSPPLGMFLINSFDFTVLFLTCIALSLCSFLTTTQLSRREIDSPKGSSLKGRSMLSRKALPPAIISFFDHFIWGGLTAFFPLYALSQGVANPGFFFAVFSIVTILGRALGGKIMDLHSREEVILPCLTTYIISIALLAFSKTLSMFILVAALWGTSNAFLLPSLVAYTLDRTGPSRGPAMGTFTALGDLGLSLGPVVMGIILHFTGYPIMFLSLALTGIINLSYFYFCVREKISS